MKFWVEEEIESAPSPVRTYFDKLSSSMEIAEIDPEVLVLGDAYLAAGIVTRKIQRYQLTGEQSSRVM
uniref:Uncharacterized protein n=1 Tax=Candidatus Kentrum sp. FW TaxID=2126338 RepID=A0A450U0G2_9GAMM|nr:MAG: hypothetical protein BECKFW1821C_GA0114237_108610 [Candidatus Kentron sp. FW]